MSHPMVRLSSLLIDVERELRVLGLWEDVEPSVEALASIQPFAVDTLSFTQWLQFIFIFKMRSFIEEDNLPNSCAIAPMAEEHFAQLKVPAKTLLEHLKVIDELITG